MAVGGFVGPSVRAVVETARRVERVVLRLLVVGGGVVVGVVDVECTVL